MRRKKDKPTEYVVGTCPDKTNFAEVIFMVSRQNPIPWNVISSLLMIWENTERDAWHKMDPGTSKWSLEN